MKPTPLERLKTETERRSSLLPTEIKQLAANLEFENKETIRWNANSGHACQLREFAGFPDDYIIKAVLQHGIAFGHPELELETRTKTETMFPWGKSREETWKILYPERKIVSIGSPFFYAKNLFSEEYVAAERRRLGKNLLFLPAHYPGNAGMTLDRKRIFQYLEGEKARFDSVRICLYFRDIQQGEHEHYLEQGYECVTAGHVFDSNFCGRLRSLLEICDASSTNWIGSYVGYSVYMNKPVLYCDTDVRIFNNGRVDLVSELGHYRRDPDFVRLLSLLRTNEEYRITSEMRRICSKYWGFEFVKTKGELREIIEDAEKRHQKPLPRPAAASKPSKVYSFDIFDTLLTRKTASPEGVFQIVQSKLARTFSKELPTSLVCDFPKIRVECHRNAKRACKNEEVTAEEIFENIGRRFLLSQEQVKRLLQLEIETELEVTSGITENIDKVHSLLAAGERVVLISDMYLPKNVILDLLRKASPLIADKCTLYLSSDVKKKKHTGNLYRHVLQHEDISPKNLIHTGDNAVVDIQSAKELGITTVLYSKSCIGSYEKLYYRKEGLFPEVCAGIAKEYRTRYPVISDRELLGMSVAGPLLYGFVLSLMTQAAEKGIRRLYFVARDGHLLLQIAKKINAALDFGLELHYLYASRISFRYAAIFELGADELNWILQETPVITVRQVADRVDMLPEKFLDYFSKADREFFSDIEAPLDGPAKDRLRGLFWKTPALRKEILRLAGVARKNLLGYLKGERFFDDPSVGLVDVGWTGRTLDMLYKVVSNHSPGHKIHTFYFGTIKAPAFSSPDNTRSVYAFSDLSQLLPTQWGETHVTSLVEFLLMAPHPTTIGFEKTRTGYGPVFGKDNDISSVWDIREYQAAVCHFVDEILPWQKMCRFSMDDVKITTIPLMEFLRHPDRRIAECLGRIPFSGDPHENGIQEYAPPLDMCKTFQYGFAKTTSQRGRVTQWIGVSLMRSPPWIRRFLFPTATVLGKTVHRIFDGLHPVKSIFSTCRRSVSFLFRQSVKFVLFPFVFVAIMIIKALKTCLKTVLRPFKVLVQRIVRVACAEQTQMLRDIFKEQRMFAGGNKKWSESILREIRALRESNQKLSAEHEKSLDRVFKEQRMFANGNRIRNESIACDVADMKDLVRNLSAELKAATEHIPDATSQLTYRIMQPVFESEIRQLKEQNIHREQLRELSSIIHEVQFLIEGICANQTEKQDALSLRLEEDRSKTAALFESLLDVAVEQQKENHDFLALTSKTILGKLDEQRKEDRDILVSTNNTLLSKLDEQRKEDRDILASTNNTLLGKLNEQRKEDRDILASTTKALTGKLDELKSTQLRSEKTVADALQSRFAEIEKVVADRREEEWIARLQEAENRFELQKTTEIEKALADQNEVKEKEFAGKLKKENETYYLGRMKKDFPSLGAPRHVMINMSATQKPYSLIVGHPYSGTTIVNEVMGQHPDIYPFWDNVVPFGNNTCSESLLFAASINHFMPEETIQNHLNEIEKKSFGKKVVLEKGPDNILYLDRINMFLPNAKFICMLRDGRDVICSKFTNVEKRDLSTVEVWADSWLKTVEIMENYIKRATNMKVVRLEDFTANPHAIIHDILDFIALDHSPEIVDYMLRYHERKNDSQVPAERVKTGDARYGTGFDGVQQIRAVQRKQPIYKDTSRWRTDLPVEFWPLMYGKIGPTLERLGYVENAEQSLREELEHYHREMDSARNLEFQLEEKRRSLGLDYQNPTSENAA